MNKNENVKEEKNTKIKKNNRGSMKKYFIIIISMCLVVGFSINRVKDFIVTLNANNISYEIKYERDKDIESNQKLYRLYKNGEYWKDVDINKYGMLDDKGNTDYKYCALMDEVYGLTGHVLVTVMFFLALLMAYYSGVTPFNKTNVILIRSISILMLLYAVLPGAIRLIMTIVRFSHYSSSLDLKSIYLIWVAVAVAIISHVFSYGVKLQEDNDSIA